MNKHLVLTLTGHDRVGIVEQVTKLVFNFNGNVEESRMARLGGEFAMLMLISITGDSLQALENSLKELQKDNFVITVCETESTETNKYAGWLPYELTVNGADHEGIIHHITHYLAANGINIETMDTHMVKAPMSGTPLFIMDGIIVVPPDLKHCWQDDLFEVGDDMNVDIEISAYIG